MHSTYVGHCDLQVEVEYFNAAGIELHTMKKSVFSEKHGEGKRKSK